MRAFYSTLPADSPEMITLKEQILPHLNKVLERNPHLAPTEMPSFIEAVKSIYGLAAYTADTCLAIILTDMEGDRQEIRKLLSAIPPNLQLQVFAVGEVGARNISKLRHLTSEQLAFGIVVTDTTAVRIVDQLLTDLLRPGNDFN